MDLRLREVTWMRLLTLLAWTILVMLKRGITQLIDAIEERVFERGAQASKDKVQEREIEKSTLLPPLSDEIVLARIWPLLHKRVNISLLWRLRRVNRAWRDGVATSLEWAALEVVRVDNPGFIRYLEKRHEQRPSLRERVEDELQSVSELLSENLLEFVVQSERLQSMAADFEDGEERWSSSASSAGFVCACMEGEFLDSGYVGSNSECDCTHSEEVEFGEICGSSTEGSLRVHFPRHSVRVRG